MKHTSMFVNAYYIVEISMLIWLKCSLAFMYEFEQNDTLSFARMNELIHRRFNHFLLSYDTIGTLLCRIMRNRGKND